MKKERTKIGEFMFNLINKLSIKLSEHKILYYVLNYTWGIITSLLGCLISLILICINKKPEKWENIWYFKICKSWGGMEMGTMFIRDTTSSESVNKHEYGHTFQNAILGPLFIFLVAIPSAIRYWYQEIRSKKGLKNTEYDLIWFEGSATYIGNEVSK